MTCCVTDFCIVGDDREGELPLDLLSDDTDEPIKRITGSFKILYNELKIIYIKFTSLPQNIKRITDDFLD